ncbi:unnamed protein product [Phaedon cochleariae]|uniref:Uncharacterized protein n=1 Tax=Phaedon cochleariae TaxID=80249 RepID=A0A9P0DIL0_PHACE|nr:unnamed protein product [Phaedon cochleariae]
MKYIFSFFYVFFVVVVFVACESIQRDLEVVEKINILSRRKRYVAFPEGSSFVATLCATIQTVTGFSIYYEGINWGISWLLPNRSSVQEYVTDYRKRRRQRRDLYTKIEQLVDKMGFDGRSCIYRALCEAPRRFNDKPETLSEDLLRIIFKFPTHHISNEEPRDHLLYHRAYRKGFSMEEQQDCERMFPDCPISLIDLALGNSGEDGNKDT